jgi:hypothetical protein
MNFMKLKGRQRFGLAWLVLMILELGISAAVWADSPKPQQLSVDQAIRIAMGNNLQRRLAQNDVKVAQDKLAQAVSAYGPKLTLEGNYYHYNEVSSSFRLAQSLAELSNYVLSTEREGPDDGLDVPF